MTTPQRDFLFDQALDAALVGNQVRPEAALDPEANELLILAQEVRSALTETPPPPHGLRPARSAFLTAAVQSAPARPKGWGLAGLGRAFNWLAPAAAVVILALLLTTMFRANLPPIDLGVIQPLSPSQPQSDTPLLLPPPTDTPTPSPTPSPTPTATPTSTPTPTATPQPTATPEPSSSDAIPPSELSSPLPTPPN